MIRKSMLKKAGALLMGSLLASFAGVAAAISYEIREIEATPSPTNLKADGTAVVKITVTVKPMGSMGIATPPCEALIDLGDGSGQSKYLLGVDGRVRTIFNPRYAKAGVYSVSAKGAPGGRGCDSEQRLDVTILEAGTAAPVTVAPTPIRRAVPSNKPPTVSSIATPESTSTISSNPNLAIKFESPTQPQLLPLTCPLGWTLVPNSQRGSRFSCEMVKPDPLLCESGSSYFETGNIIGCR